MALAVCNGGDSKPIHHLHEMADPNARLIAAAPELLAAVRGFLLGSESDEKLAKAVGEDVVREARAALAKAEGRSL